MSLFFRLWCGLVHRWYAWDWLCRKLTNDGCVDIKVCVKCGRKWEISC